jgi:hypothetical protein
MVLDRDVVHRNDDVTDQLVCEGRRADLEMAACLVCWRGTDVSGA